MEGTKEQGIPTSPSGEPIPTQSYPPPTPSREDWLHRGGMPKTKPNFPDFPTSDGKEKPQHIPTDNPAPNGAFNPDTGSGSSNSPRAMWHDAGQGGTYIG